MTGEAWLVQIMSDKAMLRQVVQVRSGCIRFSG